MHHFLSFTILLGSIIVSKSAHINTTKINQNATTLKTPDNEHANETAKQIEALQKEKNDLYEKIVKAIDEAVPELQKTNDTEAITGLEHLKTLKQQIKEIHEEDSVYETDNSTESHNATDFRRKISISIDRKGNRGQKGAWLAKMEKDEFYQKLLKNRDKKYTSMPNVLNRQKIAKQIQDWLTKKAEEKKKILEYKAKMKVDYERCPDYGKGKEKRKKGKKNKGKNVFPCCRKCCKKSYLGCL